MVTTIFVIVVAFIGVHLLLESHAASNLVLGDYEGAGNAGGIAAFASETKTTVGIAADYNGGPTAAETTWADIESSYPASTWTGKPYLLQLGVPMLPGSGATLADGAAGDYNSYFTTLAQNLVAAGESNAILRIGWEWDESTSPWYAAGSTTDATDFATYWQQIVTAMRAVPGANFNYSWYFGDANTDGVPGAATAITNDAYPGDSYVSSISLDFYDQTWTGSCNLPYNITTVPTPAGPTPPSELITATEGQCVWNGSYLPALNGLTTFASAHNKPIGITEWGAITRSDGHGLGDDPYYINNLTTWMKANNVTYASYFDFDPGLSNGGDSVLSTYPQSLAAYTADLGSFGSSTTGSTTGNTKPTVSLSSPSANTEIYGKTYGIDSSASANDSGSISSVQLLVNGTSIATDTSSPYNFSLNTLNYHDGTYTIEVLATDNEGNTNTASESIYISNGDLTFSHSVGITDLTILASNWGKSGETYQEGNITNGTAIGIYDLAALASNWGWSE